MLPGKGVVYRDVIRCGGHARVDESEKKSAATRISQRPLKNFPGLFGGRGGKMP